MDIALLGNLQNACRNGLVGNLESIRALCGVDWILTVNIGDASGNTPLMLACGAGHTDVARILLAGGAFTDEKNDKGLTALMLAVINGHASCAGLLCESGADPHMLSGDKKTAMDYALEKKYEGCCLALVKQGGVRSVHAAISSSMPDIAMLMLHEGTSPGERNKTGESVLMAACSRGYVSLAKELILRGEGVHEKNENGLNIIYYAVYCEDAELISMILDAGGEWGSDELGAALKAACQRGNLETVKRLINRGADPVKLPDGNSFFDKTPFETAAENGRREIMEYLHSIGCTGFTGNRGYEFYIDAIRWGNEKILGWMKENGKDYSVKEADRAQALVRASHYGLMDIVQKILEQGADPDSVYLNDIPLIEAVKSGRLDVVQLLIAYGATVDIKNKDGETPLHEACEKGFFEIAELLLKIGADPGVRDNLGNTPFFNACYENHERIAFLIISKGRESIDVPGQSGNSPLIEVCGKGNVSLVELLLNNNANVNARGDEGETALMNLCRNHFVHPIAEMLLQNGARIDAADDRGRTAISYAAANKEGIDAVRFLISAGANPRLTDNKGRPPVFFAVERGNRETILLLQSEDYFPQMDETGSQLLLDAAVRRNDTAFIEFMFRAGAAVNSKDSRGKTVIFTAVEKNFIDAADMLIAYGADLNITDGNGMVPLFYAESCDMTRLLAESGALDTLNDDKRFLTVLGMISHKRLDIAEYILDIALRRDFEERRIIPIVDECIKRGQCGFLARIVFTVKTGLQPGTVDRIYATAIAHNSIPLIMALLYTGLVSESGNCGEHLMIWAVEKRNILFMEYLISRGAPLNACDMDGNSLLMKAALKNDMAIAAFLAKKGAAVDHENSSGDTSLGIAVLNKNADMVKLLIDAGANVNRRTCHGSLPFDLALETGSSALIELFTSAGAERSAHTTEAIHHEVKHVSAKEIYYHRVLAEYFGKRSLFGRESSHDEPDARKCIEQPWQEIRAGMLDEAVNTLTDILFIEASVRTGVIEAVEVNYTDLLSALPEQEETRRLERERSDSIKRWNSGLADYYKRRVNLFPVMDHEGLMQVESIADKYLMCCKENKRNFPVRECLDFLRTIRESIRFLHHRKYFTIQMALNSSKKGVVAIRTSGVMRNAPYNFFIHDNRPEFPQSFMMMSFSDFNGYFNARYINTNADISVDGEFIAYSTVENRVRIMDTASGEERWSFGLDEEIRNIKISPDMESVVAGTVSFRYSVHRNMYAGPVYLIDLKEYLVKDGVSNLENVEMPVFEIAPDCSGLFLGFGHRGRAVIYRWDWKSGNVIKIYSGRLQSFDPVTGILVKEELDAQYPMSMKHDWHVTDMVTGVTRISKSLEVSVKTPLQILDRERALLIESDVFGNYITLARMENMSERRKLVSMDSGNCSISVSADKRYAAVVANSFFLTVYDLQRLQVVRKYTIDFPVEYVKLSADGHIAAVISHNRIAVLNCFNGAAADVTLHSAAVTASYIDAERLMTVTGDSSGVVASWNLRDYKGKVLDKVSRLSESRIHGFSASADESLVWGISGDCRYNLFIDTGRKPELRQVADNYSDNRGKVLDCVLSSDSRTSFVCGRSENPYSFDLAVKERRTMFESVERFKTFITLALSPDETILASGTYGDGFITWNTVSGRMMYGTGAYEGSITGLLFAARGKCIITADGGFHARHLYTGFEPRAGHSLRVWCTGSGEQKSELSDSGSGCRTMRLLEDERTLVSGHNDGCVRLWDITSGSLLGKTWLSDIEILNIIPCGRNHVVVQTQREIILADYACGDVITVLPEGNRPSHINLRGDLMLVGRDNGECEFHRLPGIVSHDAAGSPYSYSRTTAVCMWRHGSGSVSGRWDDHFTSKCPRCGKPFATPGAIIDAADSIGRSCGLLPDDSPCVSLPEEAWDDPVLSSVCPGCGSRVMFNPFVIDNRRFYGQ